MTDAPQHRRLPRGAQTRIFRGQRTRVRILYIVKVGVWITEFQIRCLEFCPPDFAPQWVFGFPSSKSVARTPGSTTSVHVLVHPFGVTCPPSRIKIVVAIAVILSSPAPVANYRYHCNRRRHRRVVIILTRVVSASTSSSSSSSSSPSSSISDRRRTLIKKTFV